VDAGACAVEHVIVTARGRATHLPGVAVLAGYRREWLRGDLLAGVAVAAYLVPQVMAYSGIAGLPSQTGLWACLGSLAIYAVARVVAPAAGRPGVDDSPDGDGGGVARPR
jgi:hypothetical protein